MIPSRPAAKHHPTNVRSRRTTDFDRRTSAALDAFGIHLHWSPTTFIVGIIVLAVALGLKLGGAVGLGLSGTLLVSCALAFDRAAAARQRQRAALNLPTISLLIGRAIRAGQPLEHALIDVAEELPRPPEWLATASAQLAGGRPLDETLGAPASLLASEGAQLLLATLRLGSSLGGDVSASLDLVGDGLRSDLELDARRRVLLSQAQLSSTVLVLMPLAFAVALSALQGGFIYDGSIGMALLLGGVGLDIIGVWWMRRLTNRLRVTAGLPAIGMLLQVAASVGLTPRKALSVVVAVCSHSPVLAEIVAPLRPFSERLSLGADFDAVTVWFLTNSHAQTDLLRLLDVLRRGEHDGVALGNHLAIVVRELRQSRAVALDVAAQRLTVGLLAPLMVCILPAFVLLAVAPLLLDAFASLPG